jgi:ketosteroid isomerase-like protein
MSQENVETVRRLSEAFQHRSEGADWTGFYASEVERDRARRRVAGAEERFDQLRWDREMLIDAGDRVVGLFRQRGRRKVDRTWVEERVAAVFQVRGGKVVETERYRSWSAALESVRPTEQG